MLTNHKNGAFASFYVFNEIRLLNILWFSGLTRFLFLIAKWFWINLILKNNMIIHWRLSWNWNSYTNLILITNLILSIVIKKALLSKHYSPLNVFENACRCKLAFQTHRYKCLYLFKVTSRQNLLTIIYVTLFSRDIHWT